MSDTSKKIYLWFDIDNTLYSKSAGINEKMGALIHDYFVGLGLNDDDAHALHMRYYTDYGLAIRGLARHHTIDPLDYDAKCDGSLPLESLIGPDPRLSKLFEDIDTDKANIWAITNAYKTHATRVLSLLQLRKHIQGLVYCDYASPSGAFSCKPEAEFYTSALAQASSSSSSPSLDPAQCYFVDDSLANVRAAKALGWGSCVWFQELVAVPPHSRAGAAHDSLKNGGGAGVNGDTSAGGVPKKKTKEEAGVDHVIHDIQELREVWPEVFKQTTETA